MSVALSRPHTIWWHTLLRIVCSVSVLSPLLTIIGNGSLQNDCHQNIYTNTCTGYDYCSAVGIHKGLTLVGSSLVGVHTTEHK